MPRIQKLLVLLVLLAMSTQKRAVAALDVTEPTRTTTLSIRHLDELLSSTGFLEITLRFSVWFPDLKEYDVDVWSIYQTNDIRKAVLSTTLNALCDESDMIVVNHDADFDPSAAENICLTKAQNETTRRRLDEGTFGLPAILASDPDVVVRVRSRDRLTWSSWALSYTVLQIGDIYIQEALQNEPTLQFAELAESSTNAMEQVAQLSLDLSIMEGTFDALLQAALNEPNSTNAPIRVHGSPIRIEVQTFQSIYNDLYADTVYEPESLSVMRLCGAALLLVTVCLFILLNVLAVRRRKRQIRMAKKAQQQEAEERDVLLRSPQDVEDMLQKSSFASPPSSPPSAQLPVQDQEEASSSVSVATSAKDQSPRKAETEGWDTTSLTSLWNGLFSSGDNKTREEAAEEKPAASKQISPEKAESEDCDTDSDAGNFCMQLQLPDSLKMS